MKRLLALLLTLVLVMSLFAACEGKKKDKDDDDDEETTEASGVDTTNDVVKPIEDPTDDNTGNAVERPLPGTDAQSVNGTWTCTFDAGELFGEEAAGLTMTYTLEIEDDVCSMTAEVMGESNTLTGTIDIDSQTITIDGETMTYELSGGTLVIDDGEFKMEFNK